MVSISAYVECPYCDQEHCFESHGEMNIDYFDTDIVDCVCGGRFTVCLDLTTTITQDRPPAETQTEIVEYDPNQLSLF